MATNLSIISFILFLTVATEIHAKDCFRCVCERESGCRPIGCHMDVGSLSCGYFQIKLPYYKDCGTPDRRAGESVEAAWRRCANDYSCAEKCVKAYVARYASKCPGRGKCEQMSRLHNGGPGGCSLSATVGYWNAIKKCCGGCQ